MSSTAANHHTVAQPLTTSSPAVPLLSTNGGGDPSTAVLRNRGVPSAMGTVRLGGSGRPFPVAPGLQALTRNTTIRNKGGLMASAATVARPAVDGRMIADPRRHVALERHPSSPFGRKIELTQKLILVPDASERERFQVRKSIIKSLPHKRKLQGDTQKISSEQDRKTDRPANLDFKKKKNRDPQPPISKRPDSQLVAKTTGAQSSRLGARGPRVTGKQAHHQIIQRPPAIDTSYDHLQGFPAAIQPKQVSHDSVMGNYSVTGIPTDLQLFTQRTGDYNSTKTANKAFHIAFHDHATNQSHQRSDSVATNNFDTTSSGGYQKTAWRQVDESIEHIYEDPSTDFVQLKLLAHKSGQSSKRQKLLERERVLAAASELRERQQIEQAHFEASQRKKSQVEQLSEAIRARNRKLVVVKSEPIYDIVDRVAAAKRDDEDVVEPKRKPPVPRQRGRRKAQLQTRNSQLKAATDAIAVELSQRIRPAPVGSVFNVAVRSKPRLESQPSQPGSVSSSILLGDSSEFAMKDVRQSIGEESQEVSSQSSLPQDEVTPTVSPPEQRSEAEQRPPPLQKRSRATCRTLRSKSTVHEEEPIPAVSTEQSERRELAREYMELQKQSRHLRSAKEKHKLELDNQRRRLQLGKLEQERIESLRRSKKKSFKRSRVSVKTENDEHHSLQQGFRGPSEGDKNSVGFAMSGDDSDIGDLRKIGEDHDDEFFESDQENQRNSRNRSFERASNSFGRHDASVLIGYSAAENKHSSVAAAEAPATTSGLDVRLRRLLELEEKTLRLSMLVNGMKWRIIPPPSTKSAQHRVTKEEAMQEDDLRFVTARQDSNSIDDYDDPVAKSRQDGDDEEKAASSVNQDPNSSGGEESEVESSFREGEIDFHDDKDRPSSPDNASDHEGEDSGEARHVSDTQFCMSLHAEEVRVATSASIDTESAAVAQLSYLGKIHELDPRTIGVHSIKVEWPVENHQSDDEEVDDNAAVSPRHSSASSQASSRSELHQNQLLSSSRASMDSDHSAHSADPFEASIHSYMQQRRLINHVAEAHDEGYGHEVSSSSHSSPRVYRAEVASLARHERASDANEAFLRLVREADDSLSVINSTAKKIWLQQQQKLLALADKQRQRELEARMKEQERKDQQLKAVMDSLTTKHVSESDGESDNDRTIEHESSSLPHELPFSRLEDIMQQIEDDKLRKSHAALTMATDTEPQLQSKPASLFWNDMLASSEPLTRNNNSKSVKLNIVIDRSELLQQQTQREQEEAEDAVLSQSYQDELKRLHSPKTLSRLLLAEVEYNEAIHEAHLQLSIMEHAQVVEQAQEETMNVATAFKEEMESNFTSHQLALEHAILSKQFDGDLRDVMQELEVIQQTQAQELEATTASIKSELKLANLREVTVQTEELMRADVATNAKLYAESGTATSPLVCDAAVQYEAQESPAVVDRQILLVNQQLKQVHTLLDSESVGDDAYSEEEYEEDNFERESQSVMTHDSVKQTVKAGSTVAISGSVNSEIPEDEDELGESAAHSGHASETGSVSDDAENEGEKKLKQSVVESSANPSEDDEIHSEAYDDEAEDRDRKAQSEDDDSMASSAIDEASAVSDRKNATGSNNSQGQVASASMIYEDDFDVSTSQVHAIKKSDSVGSEIAADNDADSESEANGSGYMTDDIEEDEVQSETGDQKKTKSDIVASERSEYSSEFSSGTAKEEPRATAVATVRAVNIVEPTVSTQAKPGSIEARRITEPQYTPLILGAHNNDVMPAYQRDLEQRRQSDESLLNLRLQVLERKFQIDLQTMDQAIEIANADSVPGKHQELQLRREAAKMAFLSEKASIESLRAASMARYYQDLLAFQSLMAGVDPSFSVAVPVQRVQYASVNPVVKVRSDLSRVVPDEVGFKRGEPEVNAINSVKNEDEDEFDSASEKAELEGDGEVSEGGVKSQGSVSEASQNDEASEILDDDASSAKESIEKSVESDHAEEEEGDDTYEDEFASVTNSDAVDSAQNDNVEAAIEDDFEEEASVKSEAPSEIGSDAEEDEIDKNSVESKDGGKKAYVEEYDDDYEDEFGSASEIEGANSSNQAAVGDEADEIVDEASEEGANHQSTASDDDTSQVQSENFKDDFESDDECQGAAAIHQKIDTKADSNLLYSNDFDTEAARFEATIEKSQGASKQLDVAGTVMMTEQSGSEDSSTTKLLIEQVQQLQQQTEKLNSEDVVQHAGEKLARKKIKAIELVQAKERLIKLEKNKFKLEEEQRQVNALAQLAIQMDVNSELSKAKEQIKQQLENEMASVQQSFPAFARSSEANSVKDAVVAQGTITQPATETTHTAELTASAPKTAVVKAQSSIRAATVDDASEDEYEVDSFEEEPSVADDGEDDYKEEYPSFAEEDESQVEEIKSLKKALTADEDTEIVSEAEDEFASVSGDNAADGSEIRSERSVEHDDDTVASGRDVKSEAASVDDYADEYEDESFDDANSVKSTQTEEIGGDAAEVHKTAVANKDGEAESDQYEEYSEEDFEKASEASEVELNHSDENDESADGEDTQDVPSPVVREPVRHTKAREDHQQQHVSIDELSTALEVVTSQLYQPAPVANYADHNNIVNLTAHDVSIALQADQSELPAQLSTSTSSHEEEILSKSIEEQTKRLEELKRMILARKDEILSVQKHLRIEKRKEQLAGQEKLLWDEMERVESNLRLDEAALELTCQRNRLEAMQLESKHDERKAKLPSSAARPDLLESFDFVEIVETPYVQAQDNTSKGYEASESKMKNKAGWGATSDMICQTDSSLVARLAEDYDLLTGYVYIEEADRVPVGTVPTLPIAPPVMSDTDKPVITDDPLSKDNDEMDTLAGGDELCAALRDETSFQDQDPVVTRIDESDPQHPVQAEGYGADLLSGYSAVEAVELLNSSDGDLLASFDFVEDVDPVESQELSERGRAFDLSPAPANECALELPTDDLDEDDIACESGGDECNPPPNFRNKEDDTVRADSPATLPEDQQRVADSRFNVQLGPHATTDGAEFVVDRVADAVYDKLFDDVWQDSQELRRRRIALRGLKQKQDAGRPSRELEDAEADDREESIDNLVSDDNAVDLVVYGVGTEATETHHSSSNDTEPVEAASRIISSEELADQLTSTLFSELYDQVLDASIHETFKKKQQHTGHRAEACVNKSIETNANTVTGGTSAVVVASTSSTKQTGSVSSAAPQAGRDFVSSLVRGVAISSEGIQMPVFNNVTQPAGLKCARVIFESVREIATSVFSRLTALEYDTIVDQHRADIEHVEAFREEVQVEMERILSIRDAGNEELKRFTQSLSESSVSDDANETSQDDLRLMQTQFRTSVSLVTDHMRRTLLLDGGAGMDTTTSCSTPGALPRSFYPRTPTPRASSSYSHHRPAMLVHTLLRHEAAKLHERITDLILDDLLTSSSTMSDNDECV